jgi:hypothetical protein
LQFVKFRGIGDYHFSDNLAKNLHKNSYLWWGPVRPCSVPFKTHFIWGTICSEAIVAAKIFCDTINAECVHFVKLQIFLQAYYLGNVGKILMDILNKFQISVKLFVEKMNFKV